MAKNEIKLDKRATDYLKNKIGGGSGGGVVLVDELPEKGDIGTLYRLNDGIYEWYHRETQVPVYEELEVGKSYLMKESLTIDDFDFVWDKFFDGRDRQDVSFILSEQEEPYEIYFDYSSDAEIGYGRINTYAMYSDGNFDIVLQGFTEIPSIEITEYLVSDIETDGEALSDLQFLFKLEVDHYDTVIEEGYIKIFGAIQMDFAKIYDKDIFLDDENYDAKLIYDTVLSGGTVSFKNVQSVTFLDNYVTYYDSEFSCMTMELRLQGQKITQLYLINNPYHYVYFTDTGEQGSYYAKNEVTYDITLPELYALYEEFGDFTMLAVKYGNEIRRQQSVISATENEGQYTFSLEPEGREGRYGLQFNTSTQKFELWNGIA